MEMSLHQSPNPMRKEGKKPTIKIMLFSTILNDKIIVENGKSANPSFAIIDLKKRTMAPKCLKTSKTSLRTAKLGGWQVYWIHAVVSFHVNSYEFSQKYSTSMAYHFQISKFILFLDASQKCNSDMILIKAHLLYPHYHTCLTL